MCLIPFKDYFMPWNHYYLLFIADKWFYQDRATCHTEGQTIELLAGDICSRISSREGSVKWPNPFIRFDSFTLFSNGIFFIQDFR